MSDLLYEVKDRIATITLNRPDKLNAFTRTMINAWAESLAEAQRDDNVNVIVVTGSGRAFCSGGDVGRMREADPARSTGRTGCGRRPRVPKTLETADKPVIAMVNGLAVGAGMGMCVMCDVRVAARARGSRPATSGWASCRVTGTPTSFRGSWARPGPSSSCGRPTSSRPRRRTGWGS